MIRAVILDDEVKGSNLLQHKLQAFSDVLEVVSIFNDPKKALLPIQELQADVLFLDVEMPIMNGFQFLEALGQFEFEVIFVTAYNIYTLDALRANALDYLLKPVDPEELEKAIEKLQKRIHGKEAMRKMDIQDVKSTCSRIALPTAEGIHLIKREDILRIEAMSNYSVFYLISQSKIIVSKTLKEYENLLEDRNFLRINRSVIVNLDYVVKYKKGDGGQVETIDGAELEVSSSKKQVLMERLFS
ncbi:LytR/AlgR family response regulator transcription factor [Sphingobacterium hotanense]|uniref:LytR/AlgR family response regulator transcription factor n=1 Tax=Sphingobacterium hotanense TaxID=649196 RepID=UPI0021A6F1D6|nr:LytTR family DNA-binding domain-containing protein [Sphingobacterium hotanense]MCT1524556.1 LytTR family DNA-binding domain-containing protein [Sphingobacterium hotanense]